MKVCFRTTMALAGALGMAGMLAAIGHAEQAASGPQAVKIGVHGLPVGSPVRKPIQMKPLTRDQLLSSGNANDIVAIQQLFYVYLWYHDTHDGPGIASLFAPDGVLETLYNNGGKTIEPNAGPNGRGCFSYGPAEITKQFPQPGDARYLGYPGYSHNSSTDILVKVDGDRATMWARWATIRSNLEGLTQAPPGSSGRTAITHHNGTYLTDLVRTASGWRFVHHRAIEDARMKFGTPLCEQNVVK